MMGVDNVCFGGDVGDVGDVGYIVFDSFSYFWYQLTCLLSNEAICLSLVNCQQTCLIWSANQAFILAIATPDL